MEFDYQRKQGKRLTYHVTVNLMKRAATGEFLYSAMVHHDGDYRGPLPQWSLNATDEGVATQQARAFIERDIEDLVGLDE